MAVPARVVLPVGIAFLVSLFLTAAVGVKAFASDVIAWAGLMVAVEYRYHRRRV